MPKRAVKVDRSLNDREQIEALCVTLEEFSRVNGPPTEPNDDEEVTFVWGLSGFNTKGMRCWPHHNTTPSVLGCYIRDIIGVFLLDLRIRS
jgi:hypothetical protein